MADVSRLIVAMLAVGCFSDVSDPPGGNDASTSSATQTSSGSETSTTATVTSGDSDASSSSTDPPSECGDGIIQGAEQCDDGDELDGNGCNNDCMPSGRRLWIQTFDGQAHGDDAGNHIAIEAGGGIVVTGAQRKQGGDFDVWLRKYEPDGGLAWVDDPTPLPDEDAAGDAWGDGVAIDDEGGIVVCGQYMTVGTGPDAWLRRYTTDGVLQWTQKFGAATTYLDRCEAVAVSPIGILATGGTSDAVGTVLPWAVRLALDGAVLEAYEFTSLVSSGWGFAIEPDEGGFWLTGHAVVRGDEDIFLARVIAAQPLPDDFFVYTVDARVETGYAIVPAALGMRVFGTAGGGRVQRGLELVFPGMNPSRETIWDELAVIEGADVDPMGNVVVAGTTLADPDGDGFIAKLAPDGEELWRDTFDVQEQSDGYTSVAIGADGMIAVTGWESVNTQGTNVVVVAYAP